MRLRSAILQDYRNIPQAQIALEGMRVFLLGPNGQGKTNLMEALGLLTALRSFRSPDAGVLIAKGRREAAIAAEVEHEQLGETRVRIHLRSQGKEVWVDQERVSRLADFIGRFPTVVFSSQDQQLIRGAPSLRRRWLDLSLSAVDPVYLEALQTYHKGLEARNALLKQGAGGDQLGAFERIMAPAAETLLRLRTQGLGALAAHLTDSYARIADQAEPAAFVFEPDWAEGDAEAFLASLRTQRERDMRQKTTGRGPHRDDFAFTLQGMPAKDFASEGQQRLLVLALRLAQASWFQSRTGVRPVLLTDDVVGELDPVRRARFWAQLDPAIQVIATGTELPGKGGEGWQVLQVNQGTFSPLQAQ